MNNQILNKAITIQGIEMKNGRYSLIDHEKQRFSFFTTKKDGTDTVPYAQFKNMGLKVGDTVQIGYVEEEYTNDYGRQISKKIINFKEPNQSEATTTAPQPEKSRYVAPTHSQVGSGNVAMPTQDAFGRRLGVQGHINALLSNPSYYSSVDPVTIAVLVKEAIAIEDEAERQLNPSRSNVKVNSPEVQQVLDEQNDFPPPEYYGE